MDLPNIRTLLVFFHALLSEGVMNDEATRNTCILYNTCNM